METTEDRKAGLESSVTSKPGKRTGGELTPGLYVTATPIGNARDITLRALDVLHGCDVVAAEDTRVTAKLFAIHGISKPLTSYNDQNGARERPKLIAQLKRGARIALVSDAGTPLVSDPGFKLVREALIEKIDVQAIPGPSSMLTALVLAGLPSDRFLFAGFLPSRQGERRAALELYRNYPTTLIFFESARRLPECLADMLAVLGSRRAAVTRELTKLYEETRRGNLDELSAIYQTEGPPKGEVTLVVSGASKLDTQQTALDELLHKALAFMPVRAAADLLAQSLSLPRRDVYNRALVLKGGHDE